MVTDWSSTIATEQSRPGLCFCLGLSIHLTLLSPVIAACRTDENRAQSKNHPLGWGRYCSQHTNTPPQAVTWATILPACRDTFEKEPVLHRQVTITFNIELSPKPMQQGKLSNNFATALYNFEGWRCKWKYRIHILRRMKNLTPRFWDICIVTCSTLTSIPTF